MVTDETRLRVRIQAKMKKEKSTGSEEYKIKAKGQEGKKVVYLERVVMRKVGKKEGKREGRKWAMRRTGCCLTSVCFVWVVVY